MKCGSCGAENDLRRRWCRSCGGRLGKDCPACGFANAASDRFCGGCGRSFADEPAAAKEAKSAPAASETCTVFENEMGELFTQGPRAEGEPLPDSPLSQDEVDDLFRKIREEDGDDG